jgi:hypothetical protein
LKRFITTRTASFFPSAFLATSVLARTKLNK